MTDLVDYTALSARLDSPLHLMSILTVLFVSYDAVLDRYGLQKVEAIGDSLVAAAGAPVPTEDHAERVVNAALELQVRRRQWSQWWSVCVCVCVGGGG